MEQQKNDENDLVRVIMDHCFQIHTKIGPGLLESVYEAILARALEKGGLFVEKQKAIPVVWDGLTLAEGFRADLLVERKVIVELKSVERLVPLHGKQLLTYLRLSGLQLGLLVNFGEEKLKNGIKRVVNGLSE